MIAEKEFIQTVFCSSINNTPKIANFTFMCFSCRTKGFMRQLTYYKNP